jgi:hypothetical protein
MSPGQQRLLKSGPVGPLRGQEGVHEPGGHGGEFRQKGVKTVPRRAEVIDDGSIRVTEGPGVRFQRARRLHKKGGESKALNQTVHVAALGEELFPRERAEELLMDQATIATPSDPNRRGTEDGGPREIKSIRRPATVHFPGEALEEDTDEDGQGPRPHEQGEHGLVLHRLERGVSREHREESGFDRRPVIHDP